MSGYASLTASFAIATDRRLRIPFISTMFKSVSPRAFEDPKDRDASDPRLKRARLLSARFSVVKRCFAFAGRKLESVRVSISTGKTGGLVPRTRRLIGGSPDLAQAFCESFFPQPSKARISAVFQIFSACAAASDRANARPNAAITESGTNLRAALDRYARCPADGRQAPATPAQAAGRRTARTDGELDLGSP